MLLLPSCCRQARQQLVWNILMENGRDEERKGSEVIAPIVLRKRFRIFRPIRVATHLLDGDTFRQSYAMLLAQKIDLCKDIAKALTTTPQRLCTRQHQRLVQIAHSSCRRFYARQLHTALKKF